MIHNCITPTVSDALAALPRFTCYDHTARSFAVFCYGVLIGHAGSYLEAEQLQFAYADTVLTLRAA